MPRLFFTSLAEWEEMRAPGERAYVRTAVRYVVHGSLFGVTSLALGAGAVDPYWRSFPILLIYGVCLLIGSGAAALLFRREWRAARQMYGVGQAPEPIIGR